VASNLPHASDILTMVAHGEGTHLNLEFITHCGLPDDEGTDSSGQTIPGCKAGTTCRRGDRPGHAFRRSLEIKAKLIVLPTCNGFSVSEESCPSNVSILLGASEGYAAAVVTTFTSFRDHCVRLGSHDGRSHIRTSVQGDFFYYIAFAQGNPIPVRDFY
jgi:hypothetical protein